MTTAKATATPWVTMSTSNASGQATSIETFRVRVGEEPRPVSPALYTDLEPGAPGAPGSPADVAAVRDALALIEVRLPSTRVAAIAYVRGTANADAATAWRAARQRLRDDLTAAGETPTEAPPGQGWDFMTGDTEITFWSAVPTGIPAERRRSEQYAATNIGAVHYVVRPVDI